MLYLTLLKCMMVGGRLFCQKETKRRKAKDCSNEKTTKADEASANRSAISRERPPSAAVPAAAEPRRRARVGSGCRKKGSKSPPRSKDSNQEVTLMSAKKGIQLIMKGIRDRKARGSRTTAKRGRGEGRLGV